MKNKLFVLVALIVAVGGIMVLKMTAPETASAPAGSVTSEANWIRAHSPRFGNPLGSVTVTEWFDPECESCRVIHPVFKQIISDYKDRVQFVLRYMPYHPHSMYAASALEESKEYGKYDEALDILFETQPQWGDHHAPKPELISQSLVKLGMPADKLTEDYLVKKHGEKIRMDEKDGNAVGVEGTPTFFINGKMLRQLGDAQLRSAINAALAETGK
ncbi:MAG: thioredoxin domain-containing protein [Bdellovibrionota bacterium]